MTTITITINSSDSLEEAVKHVSEQIEIGYTSGYTNSANYWEINTVKAS